MTDRELLELAAKAADVFMREKDWPYSDPFDPSYLDTFFSPVENSITGTRLWYSQSGEVGGTEDFTWAPLTDDGANRRLQVALKVGLVPIEDGGWACITWDHDDQVTLAADLDPNRAVVRAAAEIGKAMQQEHRRTTP